MEQDMQNDEKRKVLVNAARQPIVITEYFVLNMQEWKVSKDSLHNKSIEC